MFCGNDLDSERQCLEKWSWCLAFLDERIGIDGYRFDLMD